MKRRIASILLAGHDGSLCSDHDPSLPDVFKCKAVKQYPGIYTPHHIHPVSDHDVPPERKILSVGYHGGGKA